MADHPLVRAINTNLQQNAPLPPAVDDAIVGFQEIADVLPRPAGHPAAVPLPLVIRPPPGGPPRFRFPHAPAEQLPRAEVPAAAPLPLAIRLPPVGPRFPHLPRAEVPAAAPLPLAIRPPPGGPPRFPFLDPPAEHLPPRGFYVPLMVPEGQNILNHIRDVVVGVQTRHTSVFAAFGRVFPPTLEVGGEAVALGALADHFILHFILNYQGNRRAGNIYLRLQNTQNGAVNDGILRGTSLRASADVQIVLLRVA